ISLAELPPEFHRRAVPFAAAAAPRAAVEDLFDRMVRQRESFWSAVYPAFMTRDLTRNDLRFIVRRGLQETAGNYKMLVELLNMKPTDYKRFLNFLRKHECHVPFARFRAAGLRRGDLLDDDYSTAALADSPLPVFDDVLPHAEDLHTSVARR